MSNRNRSGRGSNRNNGSGHGEEVQIWEAAQEKINALVQDINADNKNLEKLLEVDRRAKTEAEEGGVATIGTLREYDELARKGVKSADHNSSTVKTLIEQLTILRGVQQAKEAAVEAAAGPAPGSRAAAASRRETRETREALRDTRAAAAADTSLYDFDGGGDSPVPSPISGSTATAGRKLGDRAGRSDRDSVPPKAESVEPPSLQGAGGGPGSAGQAAAAASRAKVAFAKGDEVAFKQKLAGENKWEWVLGEVAAVSGEGKSRRYKVLDVDPDEKKQKEYRSSASNMIPVPPKSQAGSLEPWETGQTVLALYPQTTTFYQAEVMGMTLDGKVDLLFDGENDSTTKQVERRFVIEYRQL